MPLPSFFGRRLADLFRNLLACCNDRLPAVIQVLVKLVAPNLAVVLAAEVLVSVRGNNKRQGREAAMPSFPYHGTQTIWIRSSDVTKDSQSRELARHYCPRDPDHCSG
jgi:hypothetical protein